MKRRTPLAVAVAGALIIGGASTGTTLALWREQAVLHGAQFKAGELTITVNNAEESSADLPPIAGLVPGGEPVTVSGLIRNTSPAAAKNLKVDVSLSQVAIASSPASTTGFSLAHLKVDVRARTGSSCPTLTPDQLSGADGYATPRLNSTAMTANQTLPICVSVAARSTMPNGASGHLAMTFLGVQVP